MIGPNTIVFFIPFSVPLQEIKFTVDGLKNWLNQKKIKEVPYLCDSVTQQWMFWVHREKKSNILFLKLSVLILMVRWVFEFPVVSIISKENFLKFWMFVFFFCHLWVCSDSLLSSLWRYSDLTVPPDNEERQTSPWFPDPRDPEPRINRICS